MVGGEGGGFGDFLYAGEGKVDKGLEQGVGVGVFGVGRGERAGALVQGDEQGAGLAEFGLEDVEIAPNGLKPRVINLRCLIMHRHQILIILPDLPPLAIIPTLKREPLQQVLQPNPVSYILRP